MKQAVMFVVILMIFATSAMGQELVRLPLEDVNSVSPKIESDATIKTQGKASIKITTRWPTTVFLGKVSGVNIESAKLVYKAKVKSSLKGTPYLEMWAHVAGGQYFSRGMNDVVKNTSDWKSIQTPFLFQKGQKTDKVTLNIVINGTGSVWIDDSVLSKEPLN